MLEFLDDHSRNNGDVAGIWSVLVGIATSGASDHSHHDAQGLSCSFANGLFGCIIYKVL